MRAVYSYVASRGCEVLGGAQNLQSGYSAVVWGCAISTNEDLFLALHWAPLMAPNCLDILCSVYQKGLLHWLLVSSVCWRQGDRPALWQMCNRQDGAALNTLHIT